MKNMTNLKKVLEKNLKELEVLRIKVKKSLDKSPEGTLVLSSSNKTIQYFHKTDKKQKKGKYILKHNEKLISALAQKDYDRDLLQMIEKEIKSIKKILKEVSEIEVSEIYEKLPEGRKRFVKPHIITDAQYVEKWLSVKYDGKEFAEGTPVILTEKGERVRSKTEKIIADKLYAMNIPYRYEYPVKLKGYGTVYPDFTLLDVAERKEICFEHFGMMDSPNYCEKAINKINDYVKSGFCLGKNLIVTFETSQHPLDMKVVERMIKETLDSQI